MAVTGPAPWFPGGRTGCSCPCVVSGLPLAVVFPSDPGGRHRQRRHRHRQQPAWGNREVARHQGHWRRGQAIGFAPCRQPSSQAPLPNSGAAARGEGTGDRPGPIHGPPPLHNRRHPTGRATATQGPPISPLEQAGGRGATRGKPARAMGESRNRDPVPTRQPMPNQAPFRPNGGQRRGQNEVPAAKRASAASPRAGTTSKPPILRRVGRLGSAAERATASASNPGIGCSPP